MAKVIEQGADALVEQGQVGFGVAVIVAVIIPETERHGHHARAGLDEAAGDEELLHQHRGGVAVRFGIALAVKFEQAAVFALIIERLEQLA